VTTTHPLLRPLAVALGLLLMTVSPLAAPLPGPGGLIIFSGGLVLVLRHSATARRVYARRMRHWPRANGFMDRALRRPSATRRRERGRERDRAVAVD
jgi:hypothetical protein